MMNKLDYIMEAFNKRAYTKKAFLLSVFSIINKGQESKLTNIPYALQRDWDNNRCYFIRPFSDGEKIYIDSVTPDKPLFVKNEPIIVTAESSNYVNENIETTIGRFLLNVVVFFESFKGKVPYINEQIDGKRIKKVISDLMTDNPKDGEELPPGKATVDECLKVTQQLDYLEGLNQVFVKASSVDVFTIDPNIIKLRDELLQDLENRGLLNDPVAVVEVINRLVAEDAKVQYNGPSKDLFINESFISNSRKKMFLVFDMAPDFHTGKYELLKKSLNEGWDLTKFSAYVNTAIDASYSRSVSVALAGADVKTVILLTGRIKAIQGDCGSKRTELVKLTERNFNMWTGGFYLDQNNKLTNITDTDFDTLKGKEV